MVKAVVPIHLAACNCSLVAVGVGHIVGIAGLRAQHYRDIIGKMPDIVRVAIMDYMNGKWVSKVPYFRCSSTRETKEFRQALGQPASQPVSQCCVHLLSVITYHCGL